MKNICTLLAAVLFTATTYAQIGINNETPDASAALDITSTTGGVTCAKNDSSRAGCDYFTSSRSNYFL